MRWKPNLCIVFADWEKAWSILKDEECACKTAHIRPDKRMATVRADSKGSFPRVSKQVLTFKPCLEELRILFLYL